MQHRVRILSLAEAVVRGRPIPTLAALLAAGLLIAGVALRPAPASAQSGGEAVLRCESRGGEENFCAARIDGGARLVRSFGSTACREGSTWRHDSRGIYVRNGCRGEFAYRTADGGGWGGGGWNGGSIEVRCSSNDGREQFCPADNRGVTLRKQESRAPCVQGETWRADRRGVYVRNGCRGVFEARQGGSGGGGGWGNGGGGPPFQIKCQSIGGRWGACPVDVGGRVRLVKRESHAECVRGWTWGVLGREAIWVSNGCRAIFEVENGREAVGRKAYDGAGDAPPGIMRRKEE
jgi:hypothetical protein